MMAVTKMEVMYQVQYLENGSPQSFYLPYGWGWNFADEDRFFIAHDERQEIVLIFPMEHLISIQRKAVQTGIVENE
jgi:hypothetical protein